MGNPSGGSRRTRLARSRGFSAVSSMTIRQIHMRLRITTSKCSPRRARAANASRSPAACSRSRERDPVRPHGGSSALAGGVSRPSRGGVRSRRHSGSFRAGRGAARPGWARLLRAAQMRRRRPVGAPFRRVPVSRPGARRCRRRRTARAAARGDRWVVPTWSSSRDLRTETVG